MLFIDRTDSGRRLVDRLTHLKGPEVVVVGLPRGGVPVAYEVAMALGAPLDVIVVRKLGVPFQPELGMGAVGEGGVRVINDEVVRMAGVSPEELTATEARERAEVNRRASRFRGARPPVTLAGRTVVVVDDGIATGSTARAACQVARAAGATRVVLAVPVAPPGWERSFAGEADELVALETPGDFFAIGQYYRDFSQTPDDVVAACLDLAARRPGPSATVAHSAPAHPPVEVDEHVQARAGTLLLHGHLVVPRDAHGLVVFAHGSGSSRHSPRNRHVAEALRKAGLGTLLFDLLTAQEELDRANVFDVSLLAQRLTGVTHWLQEQPATAGLTIGYFGASTGAAAALSSAAQPGSPVGAVVSRGGRPDLAGPWLPSVQAPTLLIVGGRDDVVLQLNREAQAQLRCTNEVVVVPGATHLFSEPGALESVAQLAADWFVRYLAQPTSPR